MKTYINPTPSCWDAICQRAGAGDLSIEQRVKEIIQSVKEGGDKAILSLTQEIEGITLNSLRVSQEEISQACEQVSPEVKEAIEQAYANIHAFHSAQMPSRIELETAPGVKCIQKPVAIGKVGLYIPGGTAPLFSTVLMLAVPALIAGCRQRVLCTPAGKDGKVNPTVLYTASRCGITDIFKIGGAQAIAAMASGTESVPRVDKIFGPGNRFVTSAKKLVSSTTTAIDMPAGPSEVMVLCDQSAKPSFVAADLLSQAEHGRDSQVVLVSLQEDFAQKVLEEVDRQAALLSRGEFVRSSLENSSAVVFDSLESMVAFADHYAPEHLIINMKDAENIAEKVTTAGSVFIGPYTPESAGDYASGTNHTLPTSAWGRSYSGVNIDSFMRKMTLQKISAEGLKGLGGCITTMAKAEGLDAHAAAVTVRLQDAAMEASKEKSAETQEFDLDSVVRRNILELCPYSTARDDFQGCASVFLDANENPYENGYNRYPDPHQKDLKAKICAFKGIQSENLFLGNGSDEAIDLIYRIFCEPGKDNVVSICPSYGMYEVAAATNDVEFRKVLLNEDFSLDSGRLLAAADSHTKALFICSPNNPSANAFELSQIEDIAARFKGIVVVDEAYIDFSTKGSAVGILERRPNVVVLQTMSKAKAMAGLRIGLAIASKAIIRLMSMVKYPYNISRAAMEKAVELLESIPSDAQTSEILSQREKLSKELEGIACVKKVFPSDANFILARFDDADATYDYLIGKGIIVRNRDKVALCKGCLRLTVGTPEENDILIQALKNMK